MSLIDHLEKLRHFVSAAEAGSFSKAGIELRLSQPTLSHSVKVLEAELGLPLFLRTSRGVQLTDGGKVLLEEARKLLEQTVAIEKKIKAPAVQPLRIATKEPLAIHFLPFCSLALDEEPEISVRRSNTELLDLLLTRAVDAVVIPDPPEREEIISYELFKDRLGIFAPLAWRKKSEPALYVFRKAMCGSGKRVEDILKATACPFVIKGMDNYEAVLAMVRNGLGLGLMPQSIVHGALGRKEIQPFEVEGFPLDDFGATSICISLHAGTVKDKRVKDLVRACRKATLEF